MYLLRTTKIKLDFRNMKQLTIILLLIFTFTACRKNTPLFDGQSCSGNCYILTGKLLEAQSNSPLSNTQLKFYFRPTGYFLFFDPTKYLGRVNTASDGSYTFKFDSQDFQNTSGYFRIEGGKRGYIYKYMGEEIEDKELLIFYLDSSKINVLQVNNLVLYKTASLKFKIKASTITSFLFLTVTYSYGPGGYGVVLNGNRMIDTTVAFKTAADLPTYVSWDAVGNGVNINRKDTLVVASGTEQTYQINL